MKRFVGTLIVGLLITASAFSHFVYIVPDNATEGSAQVIFSDRLAPDDRVDITKISETKLARVLPNGDQSPLKWTLKEKEAYYALTVPGEGTRYAVAETDYGVLQRGTGDPHWLRYYAKALFGPIPSESRPLGLEEIPLEIVAFRAEGALRFQTFRNGKPYVNAELHVISPGRKESSTVELDEEGMSAPFKNPGLYGVRVRYVEDSQGVRVGKKYEEVRHYATLVVHFEK